MVTRSSVHYFFTLLDYCVEFIFGNGTVDPESYFQSGENSGSSEPTTTTND